MRRWSVLPTSFWCLWVAWFAIVSISPSSAQQMSNLDRERAETMLQVVTSDIRKNYYDPKLHGLNWDTLVGEAKQKIEKENSYNMSVAHIAAVLDGLNDSHTFLVPPQHSYKQEYGWRFQMIGDRCFVVRVKPQTDAESKGVKPGDEILAINGHAPDRDTAWKIQYVYNVLRPQPGLRLNLKDPAGTERQVDVMADVKEKLRVRDLTGGNVWDYVRDLENERRLMRYRYVEMGDDVMILKFPAFLYTQSEVQDIIGRARKRRSLIVDLRGNPGGSVETLKWMVGGMFDHEVKVADLVTKDSTKPMLAKPFGNDGFTGKIVVLIDSGSASAAELFARVMQLEKRGIVIGDRSSGSVMEARRLSYKMGSGTMLFYGASITEADLRMTDGNSLEHTGVLPDELIVPTGGDLAAGRDPVLAHAVRVLGGKLSPESAGKLFPYEWPRE